jgi:tagatose-1,6-bisphosphate aldolase
MTTLGKYRHLMQCSTPAGHFSVLAIDHRNNLLEVLNRHAPAPVTPAEFTAFKQQILRHLLPAASAVLTDPEHGFGVGIASGVIGGQVGILSPVEVTDYSPHPSRRVTRFISGWSVGKIKRFGGSGVKLLLYYHPGAANAQGQRDIVSRIVDECAKYDLPFFLEPVTYSLDVDKPLDSAEQRQVVVEMARTFSAMGVDVLKMQFPVNVRQVTDEGVWQAALAELNAACSIPWTLLSEGVDYDTFRKAAQMACKAGASGVIVGRAVWTEAVMLQGAEREKFLATTARERMMELGHICAEYAAPWHQHTSAPRIAPGWYEQYADLD